MRNLIIHSHLFKNAGSTFDWSLARNFGTGFLDHRDDAAMLQGAKYLGPFVQKRHELMALSSHHLKFPLPKLADTRLFPALFLRHPVDRIASVYTFERRQDSDSLGARMAKKMSFDEYVGWRMRADVPITIRNFQTSRCLDIPDTVKTFITRPLTEADYLAAKRQIDSIALLGVVDMYDESMVLFEEYLKPYFPDIDLSYIRQNVTSGRKKSLSERVRFVFSELSLDNVNKILICNHWDMALYLDAKASVEDRMKKCVGFSEKLTLFRARCGVEGEKS